MTATIQKLPAKRGGFTWRGTVFDQSGQITDVIEMRRKRVLKKCLRLRGAAGTINTVK